MCKGGSTSRYEHGRANGWSAQWILATWTGRVTSGNVGWSFALFEVSTPYRLRKFVSQVILIVKEWFKNGFPWFWWKSITIDNFNWIACVRLRMTLHCVLPLLLHCDRWICYHRQLRLHSSYNRLRSLDGRHILRSFVRRKIPFWMSRIVGHGHSLHVGCLLRISWGRRVLGWHTAMNKTNVKQISSFHG